MRRTPTDDVIPHFGVEAGTRVIARELGISHSGVWRPVSGAWLYWGVQVESTGLATPPSDHRGELR